ncbi:ras guanine nucleotide exchange factor domain-containing protein [Lipomyces orientalis]|uniref:Ras guanine nucleotide exchange factor domain-containing protein n=1 Tax=Lipomyces orientalis TaxID=1233043 RepID=A0ACC3TEW6_9ASCO
MDTEEEHNLHRGQGGLPNYHGSRSSHMSEVLNVQATRSDDDKPIGRQNSSAAQDTVERTLERLSYSWASVEDTAASSMAWHERSSTPTSPVQFLPSSPPRTLTAAPLSSTAKKSSAKPNSPSIPQSRGRQYYGNKSPMQWKSPRSKLSRFTGSRSGTARRSSSSSSPYNWVFPTPNITSSRFLSASRLFSTTPFPEASPVCDMDAAAAAVPLQYNSTGDIIGITPARLIIHMTSPESLDYNLLSDFFMSYRLFLTDIELLRLLAARYKWAVNRSDDVGRVIRLRIFVAFRHWILNYFADDFVPSLGIRTRFTDAINEFSRYGKVRASSGDRRLLGELKRCWIRACCFYWDMPAGVYSDNVLMFGPDRCFDEPLHPGGIIGTRHVPLEGNNKTKYRHSEIHLSKRPTYPLPESTPGSLQNQSRISHEESSSPILPRNGLYILQRHQATRVKSSLSSASSLPAPSLSQESVASINEPQTPPAVQHGWLWGSLIRGKAVVDIPTDDQSIVGNIIPPSPTPMTQSRESAVMYGISDIGSNQASNNPKLILKSWGKRMFGDRLHSIHERVPPIAQDFATVTQNIDDGTRSNRVWSNEELEYVGLRIDILAASVVDTYKQLMVKCGEIGAPDGSTSEKFNTPCRAEDGLGLGARTNFLSVLQDSPSRTTQTRHNDTDVQSLRGMVIDVNDERSESRAFDFVPQESGGSGESHSENLTSIRQLPSTRLTYDDVQDKESDRVPSPVRRSYSQHTQNPSLLLHFPEFSPGNSSRSDSSGIAIQVGKIFPGLRRRSAKPDLKVDGGKLPTDIKCASSSSSSSSSSLVGMSNNGENVTRYSIPPVVGPLQALQESAPLGCTGRSKNTNVLIPGISEDIANEVMKFAEIPDDSHEGQDAVDIALQKLEGTYVPKATRETSNDTAEAELSSMVRENRVDHGPENFITPRHTGGIDHNVWMVDSSPFLSVDITQQTAERPSSPIAPRNYQCRPPSRGLNISSGRLSRLSVNSVASDVSSSVSLSIHLPFILKYRAIDLAEQLTIIDRDALAEVDWKELIELRWKQNVAPVQDWLSLLTVKDVRGVELIISRFNLMTSWVTSEIMLTRGLEERVRTIVKFIHVAAHTRELQNYSTFMQLTLALASTTVQRLQTTWENVPSEDIALFQSLEQLASPLKNFRNLREAMDKSDVSKGCVPFIGLYLSDLTFNAERPALVKQKQARDSLYSSEEDSDDESDVFSPSHRNIYTSNVSKLINLERFRTSASIIKKLLYFVNSARAYSDRLRTDPEIVSRCLYISCLDDDEIQECFQLMESP